MAWIEIHQSLPSHRKTLAMADALDLPPVYVLGHMTALWLWCLDNAPDGDLSRLSARIIALAAQWPGDPKAFRDALVSVGFVDETEDTADLHDWLDYAGRLCEHREKEKERSRIRRAAIKAEKEASQPTTSGRPLDDQRPTVGTVPNLTVPDRTGSTEVSNETSAAPAGNREQLQSSASDGKQPQETAPHDAADASASAPVSVGSKSILERYEDRLNSEKNQPAVLADAGCEIFGRPVDIPRLGRMAKKHGSGEVLRAMLKGVTSWRGVDDPLSYTEGVLSAKKNGHARAGPLNGAAPYVSPYLDEEANAKRRKENEEWTKQFYPNTS